MNSTIKLTLLAALSAVTIGATSLMSSSSAAADEVTNNKTMVAGQITEDVKNKVDPFVKLVNNQYQLDQSASEIGISNEAYEQVQATIQKSNQVQLQTPNYKTKYRVLARSTSYSTRNFWWGTRYYMYNNAQVAALGYDLNACGLALSAGAGVGAAVSGGVGGIIGVGAGYYFLAENRLNSYNNQHPHDYIYMDFGRLGNFSFGTL